MNNPLSPFLSADGQFYLDVRRTRLNAARLSAMNAALTDALGEMKKIENGEIKNPDENRQVTHFTDRIHYPETELFADVEAFFAKIRAGQSPTVGGPLFDTLVMNGIGGSALGPQMVQFALNGPYWNEAAEQRQGGLKIYFLDNTDPAGIQDLMAAINPATTLVVTVSKSGATRETRNNMLALQDIFTGQGLDFARHAAAVTMQDSELFQYARQQKWLKIWPMAESIGGRTSETAVVGHVPAAATGIDFRAMLEGACTMDEWTRHPDPASNPACLLAAVWYIEGEGRGERNMVIVPYADRLLLLSRYLQQLVMESIGKKHDRDGQVVHQGLTVYGNKGGTDAHAFIQQLNDGRDDFFITFIEVLKEAQAIPLADSPLSMGDYLHNFMQGLINALSSRQRSVIHLALEQLNARTLGMMIALYERAVALYAELIHINAFHQPGVQAYKKMSGTVNDLTISLRDFIVANPEFTGDAASFARAAGKPEQVDEIEGILNRMAVNSLSINQQRVTRELDAGRWRYQVQTRT